MVEAYHKNANNKQTWFKKSWVYTIWLNMDCAYASKVKSILLEANVGISDIISLGI